MEFKLQFHKLLQWVGIIVGRHDGIYKIIKRMTWKIKGNGRILQEEKVFWLLLAQSRKIPQILNSWINGQVFSRRKLPENSHSFFSWLQVSRTNLLEFLYRWKKKHIFMRNLYSSIIDKFCWFFQFSVSSFQWNRRFICSRTSVKKSRWKYSIIWFIRHKLIIIDGLKVKKKEEVIIL